MSKSRRLARVFAEDGNTLLVAMDHAILNGPMPGLIDPGQTLQAIIRGGADAVLTTLGVAEKFHAELSQCGLVLRMDGAVTGFGDVGKIRDIYCIEDAIRISADAVGAMGFPGHVNESVILSYLSRLICQAHAWNVPVLAEMLPGDPEMCEGDLGCQVEAVSRIGAEFGADFIKTMYTGDKKSFRRVVEGCYVPVLVLGGEKMDSDEMVLSMVMDAMEAGARGVAMGRNVWQHKRPEAFVRALRMIIHGGGDISDALKELE